MPAISKENCLIHSQIESFISRFDRKDIPFINRFCHLGKWINDNQRELENYCPECLQIISDQNKKMKMHWYEKESRPNF